jgi:light-regulated signal transduction histidine kinase (bacteriophytochrome)
MGDLIAGLLDYTRLDGPASFEDIDSGACLDAALANLELATAAAGATITRDPLPRVHASPAQVTLLLQNLIDNACKYRGPAPLAVHVGARRDGDRWRFAVQDNGIGLDMEHGERIFAMYQRLHPREAYPGTGMGLAICRKIVEGHGGRIRVESRPGEGATFHFDLPAVAPGAAPAGPPLRS